MATRPETVCLLDTLPDVTALIEPADLERARGELDAPVVAYQEGEWPEPHPDVFDPLAMGILVVEGLMARHVRLANTTTTELVGPGDLLRPPEYEASGEVRFPAGIKVTALEATRVAILDRDVTAAVCRWQPVVTWIVTAAVRRSFALAELLALSHLRRVDARLLVLFWQLAYRFGRVQPEGVSVPLRLTHETIGRVVGAQRPSVTTALNQLEAAGRVSRREGGGWLLHGEPPDDLERMR
ncbi:MAG: family transcriptional regulator, cyclic receptor protein [Thermoleophilaceae bacterium]|jgi:CRP-like cAMP-binding protein|nr:family transcriptional regulator, cyclic receptor protein [Thermoleophilaceae bacterium]MEA2349968.1 family transcriptional regulator, cyclic receptor protein [Thermoleophilaceae bacterium]MEA2352437.1 family transcriptional regulator, cyclic receptor protein [Thermoleophilaceae bacterium]MEA2367439.1 family transcriptional regulator, cyclic receptor protein [Thermoleophilaceae bacterium]MEA2389500.1 family transcriptional regulator, cyclic receptor protein [Thermoleophilaceae bacterium]